MTSQANSVPGDSWLYRLDPRVKLLFAALSIAACLIFPLPGILIGVLILAQAVLLSGGLPLRVAGQVWLGLAPLVLIILILQPLLAPGDGPALWQVGVVRITAAGLATGVRYGLQVTAAAFAASVVILATPISDLVRGLEKIGLPSRWGMMVGLALRYLATLRDLYITISEAQQVRGWDVAQAGLVGRVRATFPTLIALIVAALRLGDTLSLGLAARGFGALPPRGTRRTHLHDIAFRPFDWFALIAMISAFGGLVLLFR